jgi:hypothetical protein
MEVSLPTNLTCPIQVNASTELTSAVMSRQGVAMKFPESFFITDIPVYLQLTERGLLRSTPFEQLCI